MLTASLGHLVSAQSLSHSWPFATPCSPPGFCPWDFPSKNTEGGCHCLLQGWFHPRDGTQVSRIASGFFTTKVIWEAHRTFSTNCKPYCLFSKFNSVLNYHLSFDPRPFWPCIPSPTKSFFFSPFLIDWPTFTHHSSLPCFCPMKLLCMATLSFHCLLTFYQVQPLWGPSRKSEDTWREWWGHFFPPAASLTCSCGSSSGCIPPGPQVPWAFLPLQTFSHWLSNTASSPGCLRQRGSNSCPPFLVSVRPSIPCWFP